MKIVTDPMPNSIRLSDGRLEFDALATEDVVNFFNLTVVELKKTGLLKMNANGTATEIAPVTRKRRVTRRSTTNGRRVVRRRKDVISNPSDADATIKPKRRSYTRKPRTVATPELVPA